MADFGESTTWLKGKIAGASTYTYVNIYNCDAITQDNSTTYIIQSGGHRFKLRECVWVADLTDIAPEEG